MENNDLVQLLQNSIYNSRDIIENYERYKEDNNEGLWEDLNSAKEYLSALGHYSANKDDYNFNIIHERLRTNYTHFVDEFTGETSGMQRATRLGKAFAIPSIVGLLVALITQDPNLFYCTVPVGVISLSSFGYKRSIRNKREGLRRAFKKHDNDASSITKLQLEIILTEKKEGIGQWLTQELPIRNFKSVKKH